MSRATTPHSSRKWSGYYRWTAQRPPRELLIRTLDHIDWERKTRRTRTAVDLGFGAGNDTLELLRRGWRVLAIDREQAAAEFLAKRVPSHEGGRLTVQSSPMQGISLPKVDLVYASYSLPFCPREEFPRLWETIHRALVPGGHFAGQLFGDRDDWADDRTMTFHTLRRAHAVTKGYRIEFFREAEEEGRSFAGPKHWHVFDLILEKPR
jgi:tellurite methyltransferase